MSKVLKNVSNSSLLIEIFYIVVIVGPVLNNVNRPIFFMLWAPVIISTRKVCLSKRLFFTLALSQVSWYMTVKLAWKWPNSIQYEDLHKTFFILQSTLFYGLSQNPSLTIRFEFILPKRNHEQNQFHECTPLWCV